MRTTSAPTPLFRTPLLRAALAACVLCAALTATPTLAAPPRVLSTSPDLGEAAVDPTLTELRIEFDQDMDTRGGMSICGRAPTTTGKPQWESPRLLLIPITLEPAQTYQFSINCPSARNFRSAAGEPAEVTPIAFTTAASKAESRVTTLTPDDNRNAIENLRRAIDERYAYRDLRLVDWDAELDAATPELESAATPGRFAREAARLLAAARDVHMSLQVGPSRIGTFSPMQPPNCNPGYLQRTVPGWTAHNPTVVTGLFEDGVAYILITSWPSDATLIQPALDFLSQHADAPGVILDVRPNAGGDENTARRIAACFVPTPAVYSRNAFRDPDAESGWTPPIDRAIVPRPEGPRYAGPVAVLMGPCCMSSNEPFLLMMRTSTRATLISEPSYGSSGNPKPTDLGNGVTVFLPSWMDMLPDGTPLEGRGVIPDIGVRARPDELQSADPVLETALRAVRRKP